MANITTKERNKRAWNNLRPGFVRVWVSADTVARLSRLRNTGIISEECDVATTLGSYITTYAYQRAARLPSGDMDAPIGGAK